MGLNDLVELFVVHLHYQIFRVDHFSSEEGIAKTGLIAN